MLYVSGRRIYRLRDLRIFDLGLQGMHRVSGFGLRGVREGFRILRL